MRDSDGFVLISLGSLASGSCQATRARSSGDGHARSGTITNCWRGEMMTLSPLGGDSRRVRKLLGWQTHRQPESSRACRLSRRRRNVPTGRLPHPAATHGGELLVQNGRTLAIDGFPDQHRSPTTDHVHRCDARCVDVRDGRLPQPRSTLLIVHLARRPTLERLDGLRPPHRCRRRRPRRARAAAPGAAVCQLRKMQDQRIQRPTRLGIPGHVRPANGP